jgi:protein O-GlcNAc transferase
MAGMLEAHDRARFEIIALSHGPDLGGPLRDRLNAAFERRIDVRRMSDAAVAALSRSMGVDIAVDLKGYTQDGRPGILAHRAAPVQVSWLGYPGTLAAPYVDYVIADSVVVPPGRERDYTEAIVRLPLYQPNDGLAETVEPPSRQSAGLPRDAFVFCCLNNPGKITPETFAVWMAILRDAVGSVLWLYEGAPGVAANLRAQAAKAGIDAGRLVFAAPRPARQRIWPARPWRICVGYLALRRPHHRQRRPADGRSGADLAWQELRQPRGREPADGAGACPS